MSRAAYLARSQPGENPSKWFTIAPSDTTDIDPLPRQLHVTGAGDIVLVSADGESWTRTVAADTTINLRPVRIMATGTTATGIRGLL